MKGYNSTVLAYGQTGSGKTYTMYGGLDHEQGLIPRLAKQLIDATHARNLFKDSSRYKISLSMLEIYQEQFIDLLLCQPVLTGDHLIDDNLVMTQNTISIKENQINGLTEVDISSLDEILQLLKLGEQNRHVNSTKLNRISSRSHSICMLKVSSAQTQGLINLVDLAGSERVSKS